MAENWKNCLEEELICPICLNVFSEPVQLPCKHNFCRMCINEAWSKETGMVRCPECNHAYSQKPALEKNHKLSNIVEKFNALNVEKMPAVLHCILCRRGPPLQAQKVCLRCNAPCCHSHVQTHLQQPSSNAGHLLVDAEDVRAWSCPQHDWVQTISLWNWACGRLPVLLLLQMCYQPRPRGVRYRSQT